MESSIQIREDHSSNLNDDRGQRMGSSSNNKTGAGGVTELLRRRPWIVVLPSIAFLIVGALLGALRVPTYTASVDLAVQIGTSEPLALADIAIAETSGAVGYSRMANSDPVVDPVAHALKRSPVDVSSHESATPVPQSGNLVVTAVGSSPTPTIKLANVISASLATYVNSNANSVSNPSGRPTEIISQYQAAVERTRGVAHEVEQLRLSLVGKAAQNVRLQKREAALQAVLLEQEALKTKYQNALLGPTTSLVVLNHATSASSNRRSTTELLGFVGLLFGVAVGLAYAALSSRRAERDVRFA